MYNSKGRQIHKGPRGGEYVLQGGRKVYKFTRASAPPPPARHDSPPPRATTPPKPGFTKTPYKNVLTGLSVYLKESSGRYHVRGPPGSGIGGKEAFGTISLDHRVRNASGTIKKLREWIGKTRAKKPRAKKATPPPRAPPPPRVAVVNYEAILKRNTSRLTMNKIRRYARNWLRKNIPTNASYKRAALIIHPDKGIRTNAENQRKRVALFKLLGGLK